MIEIRRLFKAAQNEERARLRALNPEVAPDPVFGDIGYFVPPFEPIDTEIMEFWWRVCKIIAAFVIPVLGLVLLAWLTEAYARDLDGHYAAQDPQMHAWFDSLKSDGGSLCCSLTDGRTIDDPDIDMSGKKCASTICVRVDGQWLDVPEKAIVRVPNRYGRAVVWPMTDSSGKPYVRCFMAGTLS